jgi:hypothetical protein
VDNSISFLQNYLNIVQDLTSGTVTDDLKGKAHVQQGKVQRKTVPTEENEDNNSWKKT